MSNIFRDLQAVGLNPFAMQLLAESLLKSPLATMTVGKPQALFFPVKRNDCPDYVGVRVTLQAVPLNEGGVQSPTASGVAETLWSRAEAIADLPAVDEAIRALLSDNTGDNAAALIVAVLEAAQPAEKGDAR